MTQKELAGLLGYTNATVLSQILTGKKPVPKNLAERVAVLHPKINIEFLRGTSEDLLVEGERPPITPAEPSPRNSKTKAAPDSEAQKDEAGNENGIFIPHELAALFTDMSATIKSQQESINKLIEKLK